jgi:SAM-dependent methyltransferase
MTRPLRPGGGVEEGAPRERTASELLMANRRFYDALWKDARLIEPDRFNTWPLARSLAEPVQRRLEVAPGLRPRLPIEGTQFLDFSAPALVRLRQRGANAVLGLVTSMPFPDGAFELVCALDIVEHVASEDEALGELSRVAAPGAALLLSVPLHPSRWNAFDEFVGHQRRYEPKRLIEKLAQYGFTVERSAAYGMQPNSSHWLDLGMWLLVNRRAEAMWWYNRVLMPLGVRFQRKLALRSGVLVCDEVDEILLVCRKADGTHAAA